LELGACTILTPLPCIVNTEMNPEPQKENIAQAEDDSFYSR